jgi:leader peptidase (prepilin peptidase)/N-methyltransferase
VTALAFGELWPLLLAAGLIGLVTGSFLNVVVHRLPRGLSLVSPPSACVLCGSHIRGWDNIPVLSWLLLRGRCRDCGDPISVRYPLVELGTGAAFILVAFWQLNGLGTPQPEGTAGIVVGLLTTAAFFWLAAASIALALIDVAVHRLPNMIVLPGIVVTGVLLGSAALLAGDPAAALRLLLGPLALGGTYLLLSLLRPGAMGGGDVKLAVLLGVCLAYLGWGPLIVGGFSAFLLGGLFGLGLILTGRASRTSGIPFGPWMLAGAWPAIFFGDAVWQFYLAAIGLS